MAAGLTVNPEQDAVVRPIGQILLDRALLSDLDLQRGLAFQRRFGGRLGAVLVRLGALPEDSLLTALSEQLGLPILSAGDVPTESARILDAVRRSGYPPEWWLDQGVVVWDGEDSDGCVNCIARDLLSPSLSEAVEGAFGHERVKWWLTLSQDLDHALSVLEAALYQGERDVLGDVLHLRELAEEAPIVELVSNILSQSLNERASDIHVEPAERQFRVRYRIDGVLHSRLTLPRDRFDAVASRIKLLSGMDIAERRLPQDGRVSQRINGQDVDIRVSTLPGTWGESIVLRLLPKAREAFSLEKLGLGADHRARFAKAITEPDGILLVTGPTGSGKSTTLYTALEAITDGAKKIITVEDPVEYDIAGVNQVQVHPDIGYTFARALRSLLRQDPDIVMIGEIRDLETAEIAIQASLTGHLVFSTLHTNGAIAAFTRLIDMGLEPFLVVSGLRGVLAQRLVRKLCPNCAVPMPTVPDEIAEEFAAAASSAASVEPRWHQPGGCRLCHGTGYRGRMGIYELVELVGPLREAVLRRAPEHEAASIARAAGFRSLREDGLLKAASAVTSLDEVIRVTGASVAQ